ncbi:ABC transporter substrate-binding protein [Pantoea sp. ICBG 1758]|jgi:lysine/arginine/ornithine transport system substrate-binding protein|uniref:Transporter substrate-binding domain-containing protein n=1 Tax=Pantoea eucrina TaxID=472693 RepID=A0ABS1Z5E1_9GAMM|nr:MULTISPECIES: transporter substrate-binding domain-containing protein [Pantoea]KAA6044331.1 transporter substrate-binding domain-containing protein [Pantoea sp. Bo_7]KAA6090108.1 transporter substrate-binding domain-containing protein [Pantoea sp. Bo_10]MBM0747625.1 transporter substrate-binding domain-containing protein [Pantoea eucrina]MCL9648669.1 transporter substrate-binding domain-containing protein [Pantoea eucrina]MDJ0023446.1 transporter substrate-binding domain-containing protein 
MYKRISLALLLSYCAIQSAAAQQTLRFGVDPTFPPFESKASDGSLQGFDIDLGNAICAQAKVSCKWVQIGFDGSIPALQAKKFDAILSAMSMTEKRREQVAFSDMLYVTPSALITPADSALTDDIATLRGKNIGVAQGTIQETYAQTYWAPKGVSVVSYPNQMEIYPDLVAGRLDGTLANAVSADQGFLNTAEGKKYVNKVTLTDKAVLGNGVGIGLRKDDVANLKLINAALAELHRNGTYDRLAQKYFKYKVYP